MALTQKISKPFKQAAAFVLQKPRQLVQAYRLSKSIYVEKEAERFGGLSKNIRLRTQVGGSGAVSLVHIDRDSLSHRTVTLKVFGKIANYSSLSGRDNGVLGHRERYLFHNSAFYKIKLMGRGEKLRAMREFSP